MIWKTIIPENWRKRINYMLGRNTSHWCRVIMDRNTECFINSLNINKLDVLEISGSKWQSLPFGSYKNIYYPDYDFCK